MALFDISTLVLSVGSSNKALPGIGAFMRSPGMLDQHVGSFVADFGSVNNVMIIRKLDDDAQLRRERQSILSMSSPFGAGEFLEQVTCETFVPFPDIPPVGPGTYGPFYEFRTYFLKVGGLEPTLKAWAAATPARTALSPLAMVMYSTDGPLRTMHVWPYPTLEQRQRVRIEALRQKIWPAAGSMQWLTSRLQSNLFMPTEFSPLQ